MSSHEFSSRPTFGLTYAPRHILDPCSFAVPHGIGWTSREGYPLLPSAKQGGGLEIQEVRNAQAPVLVTENPFHPLDTVDPLLAVLLR